MECRKFNNLKFHIPRLLINSLGISFMKKKIIIIFIVSRFLDLYSTYLVLGEDLIRESSPIVKILNFGWLGFILTNLLISSLIIFLFYLFNSSKLKENENLNFTKINNYKEYLSYLFFNKKLSFINMIKSKNLNYNVLFHVLFYALPVCMIFIGILAIINNISVLINPTFNSTLSSNQISFIITTLILILLVIISHKHLYFRYKKLKNV